MTGHPSPDSAESVVLDVEMVEVAVEDDRRWRVLLLGTSQDRSQRGDVAVQAADDEEGCRGVLRGDR